MSFKKSILVFSFIFLISIILISALVPLPYLGTGISTRTETRLRDWYTPNNQSDYNWTFANVTIFNLRIGNLNDTDFSLFNTSIDLSSYNQSISLDDYNQSIDLSTYNLSISLINYIGLLELGNATILRNESAANFSTLLVITPPVKCPLSGTYKTFSTYDNLTTKICEADFNLISVGNISLIFSERNDSLWNASGSDIFNRDFSGNVGIGTTSPVSLLEVYQGTGIGNVSIGGGNANNEVIGELRFSTGTISDRWAAVQGLRGISADKINLLFFTMDGDTEGVSERMRIDNLGNVGIGTTSATEKLVVAGNVNITGDLVVGADGTGNVGIGITNPSVPLEILSSANEGFKLAVTEDLSATASQANLMDFLDDSTTVTGRLGFSSFSNGGSGADFLFTSDGGYRWKSGVSVTSSDVMLIDSAGKLNISDQLIVNVAGSILKSQDDEDIIFVGSDAAGRTTFFVAPSALGGAASAIMRLAQSGAVDMKDIFIDSVRHVWRGSGITAMTLNTSTGNLGIGTTTPTMGLEMGKDITATYSKPTIGVNDPDGDGFAYLLSSNDAALIWDDVGAMRFATDTSLGTGFSEKMRITSGGNVGIGTTSPDRELHIASSIPNIMFEETDASANNKKWEFFANAEQFHGIVTNDAVSASTKWITIDRTGNTIDKVVFPNGNVGIGTTTPESLLEIASPGNFTVGEGNTNNANIGSFRGCSGSTSDRCIGMSIFRRTDAANMDLVFTTMAGDPDEVEFMRMEFDGDLLMGATKTGLSDTLCWDGSGISYWGDCTSLTELKTNITSLTMTHNLWNKYSQLNPVTYYWKDKGYTQDIQLGFLAEEVEAIHPTLAKYSVFNISKGPELSGIKYNAISTANVMAIQDLKSDLETIKTESCARDPTFSWC